MLKPVFPGEIVENMMNTTIVEGKPISMPPSFDGTNCTEWKKRIQIFIQSLDYKLWLVIKNGPKIPKKVIEGQELEKSEDEFNDEDMKNMEQDARAKHILFCAVNPEAFELISCCKTAKEMWEVLDREVAPTEDSTVRESLPVTSNQYNSPNLDFVEETREAMDNFLKFCVPLYKFALEGNWLAAKGILDQDIRLKHAAIGRGLPTLLHVAAGTNHVYFVKELLRMLDDDHIILQDIKGNTAFCFAAASGNMEIAQLLMKRNPLLPVIRGGDGCSPVQFAALQGRCKMTKFLFNIAKHTFEDRDWNLLFFTCINTGNYDMALKMAREKKQLALERDVDKEETALHILAQIQMPLDSCCHNPQHQNPIMINPGTKQHVVLQLVKFLWTTILEMEHSKSEITRIISEPTLLLFDAVKVGNFGFLSEVISAYPNLIWEVDYNNRSIIHTAVLYRHASIYNIIHQIQGSLKDIIVTFVGENDKNTLLHLAAKLAPPSQLELVSGSAFQMCLELLWFEEVKKIMPPSLIKMKNSERLTARELFTIEHKKLRSDAESWLKGTAKQCMLISTVIATGVFAAAISSPGGVDDKEGKPHYLKETSFLVFAISDATAFISSATSILIFLSILVSRYAEYDFYKSLPLKLIFGLMTLFISITSMMIAFGSAFFITYSYGMKWVPDFISVVACLPVLLFVALQFPLWYDIIYSTYFCKTLFKPGKKLIYVLER